MELDDTPRVTPSMLRRADECCHRRLAHEHRGGKTWGNRVGDARFAVSNRLSADARLAHAEADVVRAEAFVDPRELAPEQRRVYDTATRSYLQRFGARPGRVADLGWRTPLPQLGVELVGDVGIALDLPDGGHELRRLSLGGRRTGSPLLDPVDVRVALVRTAAWAPDHIRIVAVDLLEQEAIELEPDVTTEREEALAWIGERVDTITRHAAHAQPRPGNECGTCAFVAGCSAHG